MDDINREQFSVVVFYSDDSHQYLCRYVSVSMAAEIFRDAVRTAEDTPLMTRVIITDGGDAVAREWTAGKGITIQKVQKTEKILGGFW